MSRQKRGSIIQSMQVMGWLATRNYRKALWGLPAIIVIVAVAGTAIVSYKRPMQRRERYLSALQTALSEKHDALAQRYASKLKQLGMGDQPHVRLLGAINDYQNGRAQRAKQILDELAPSDGTGLASAHLLVAKDLSQRKDIDQDTAKTLLHHLRIAASIPGERQWANSLMSQIYLAQGDLKNAVSKLRTLVADKPQIWFLIADAEQKLGNKDARSQAIESAYKAFSEKVQEDPSNITNRIFLARAANDAQGFQAAESILMAGLQTSPDALALRTTLAALYVQQAKTVPIKDDHDIKGIGAQIALLQRALTLVPNHPQALQALMEYVNAPGMKRKQANKVLDEILASGQANAMVHFLLATQALVAGENETAQLHFELGYKKNPNLPYLLNNLAWLLANQDKPDTKRAMELIDKAISMVDSDSSVMPTLVDTRGHVLIKRKQWKDAIIDLESSAKFLRKPSQAASYRAIAEAYEALGQKELAETYQTRADGIELISDSDD